MAIKNIDELEKALGLENGKLNEMFNSQEEHLIDLESKVVMDKKSLEERERNIKSNTIQHTESVIIKELRNEFGLEFEGKTRENLNKAFKAKFEKVKLESVKDPEERFSTLKTDFEKLQSIVLDKDKQIEDIKNEYQQKQKNEKIKNDVFSFIPDNTLVSKNTILIEAKEKGYSFDDLEGVTVVKDAQGNVIKNTTTFSPIGIKEFIEDFVTPYIAKPTGGAGGTDEKRGTQAGSYEEFIKEAEKNNWTNEKINQEIIKRTKEGTLKM